MRFIHRMQGNGMHLEACKQSATPRSEPGEPSQATVDVTKRHIEHTKAV
jgi:hypothetical protein